MAAAHTFLKKNQTDPYLTKNMNYYKSLLDVEEYLIDHEEQPYEVSMIDVVVLSRCANEAHAKLFRFLNANLSLFFFFNPECFPEECDALQQRRLQQQCPKHGAGHHTVL